MNTVETIIWHNPRCSKSRATLALLQERGIDPRVVEYQKTPPSAADLTQVIAALGVNAHDILRVKETAYRDLGLGPDMPADQLISAMVAHPKLIERPIVIHGARAAIGRPPEQVLDLF